jgi:L-fucose mutarotase
VLKNINPLLNADVLHVLAAMGHGDSIVLCDANFPAQSVASKTSHGSLLRMDGANVTEAADAVLSLMPLDTFINNAAQCMQVVGASDSDLHARPAVQDEVQGVIAKYEEAEFLLTPVDRFEFYDRASESYAVLATNERRFFGCFIFTKGVIPPEA